MKIIISIGHPAHVHYFKNTARILEDKGHKILFFIRDRECIVDLVKDLGFDYVCFGKGGSGMFSKFIQIPITDFKLLKVVEWTIENMQDKKGYFYYLKFKRYTNKIPYMRWSNSWMLLAMTTLMSKNRTL